MIVYVVIIEDRHIDTEVYLASTAEKAITYAREVAEEYNYFDEDEADITTMKNIGLLYYHTLSPEGDCVCVIPKEIDNFNT